MNKGINLGLCPYFLLVNTPITIPLGLIIYAAIVTILALIHIGHSVKIAPKLAFLLNQSVTILSYIQTVNNK